MIQAKKLSPFFSARYSDLLLSLEHSFIERFGLAGREGSFVCKTVKGRKYWYFQFMEEGKQKPVFIGPDSGGIRQAIQETKEAKEVIKQLALSLSSAGGFVFPGTAGRILSSMGDSGLFLSGAVIVGTNAFMSYQNVFGIRWQGVSSAMQTTDIDFAQFSRFKVGVPLDVSSSIRRTLADIEAHPIWKSLHPKDPTWTILMRKESFSLEFLSPLIGKDEEEERPVSLPWVGVHSQPLRFMDYLIEHPFHAVALAQRSAILVNLPDPGRFALHKLIVHERRCATDLIKKEKDLSQAGTLIGFLSEHHPDFLETAWTDLLRKHQTWGDIVKKAARKIPEKIVSQEIVRSILHGGLKSNLCGSA
ncbi:MAG: GSU2403 family nucleotidyltransferase fold protein [Leptospirillum sp.]|jgi:hypothetical protein